MWKKFARIPLSLPKRGSGVSPIWPREKFFKGPITFRTHIGAPILFTFRTYIQNIHQNYTHFTFAPLLASTSIIIPFRNYISNTHQTSIGLAPFTHLSTHSLARSFTYLPHSCLHPHSQAFYHIIITFRTYIRITFLFHQITYLALTFLFTL